jgi:hypothetical protein
MVSSSLLVSLCSGKKAPMAVMAAVIFLFIAAAKIR